HKREIESLHQRHKYQFHRWYISLMTGYNLCFYGYGSKKRLLEEFFEIHFKDQPLLVINGFEPNLKFKDALKIVLDGIVKPKLGSRRGTFEKHADLIRRYFLNPNRRTERLYIMIHNLDGPCLRNTQILDTLGLLASTHNIFVVASVDNVNAPLLFDRDRDAKFKFIWNDATTFRPYEEESIYEDLKVKKRRIGLTMSVVISILSSWIVNRRMMFKTLAAYQISRYQCGANKPEDAGMEHGLLYNKLREEFWVDGDSKFRMFLNDFHNHDVIKTRTSEFGCNIYYIPLEADVLKKVLNNKNLFE
ncbi:13756_t:CDS:1, partial [Acaulospora morrowiae]